MKKVLSIVAVFVILFSTFSVFSPNATAYTNITAPAREFYADAPHRVEPGKNIPILALVRHCDESLEYPVQYSQSITLEQIDIRSTDGSVDFSHPYSPTPFIDEDLWYDTLYVTPPALHLEAWLLEITVTFHFLDFFQHDFEVDRSIDVWISSYDLPKLSGWYAGDAHVHSSMTDNVLEFGAPVESIASSAKAMGLDWVIITDHSHDIHPGEWDTQKDLCDDETTYDEFVCMLGEEITCQDYPGLLPPSEWQPPWWWPEWLGPFEPASHYLAYGISNPIEAPEWWGTDKNPSQYGAIKNVISEGGVGFIAHPFAQPWDWENWAVCGRPLAAGIEIWNGFFDSGGTDLLGTKGYTNDQQALNTWYDLLRQGRRVFGIGNSDAHNLTNIGRYVRNYVYLGDLPLTQSNVVEALSKGRFIVTDGPLLSFTLDNHIIGDDFTTDENTANVYVSWKSNPECGALKKINIAVGGLEITFDQNLQPFEGAISQQIPLVPLPLTTGQRICARVSCETDKGKRAYTNPIWVRQAAASNVDVVLLIDRSGSMSGSKLSEAKTSAKYFTDLMHTGDKIGVVTYETSTRIDYPLTKIESTNTKTLVKNKIDQIYPAGVTAMGAGLRAAYNQLVNYGDQSHPWAIVLMSNGFHNYGEHPYNVLPALKSKNIKVYTIGLGAGADGNLLGKIATDTGGFYRYAAKPTDLVAIYQAIAAIVTQEQTISSITGSITQGETTQLTAPLDSSVVQATFSVSWGGSDLDLTLIRPDGSLIDPVIASTDPHIEYIEEARYEMYRIKCPMMGMWTMVITGVSIPPGGESFVAGCAAVADLKLQMSTDKDLYAFPQQVQINATIEDWGMLVLGASVEALVTRPDGSQINMILFDDGADLHGDQVADDGVYANYFGQYKEDGSYTIGVTATGTASTGEQFLRHTQKTVTVSGIPSDTTPPKTNLLIGPPQYITPGGVFCVTSNTPFTLDAVDNNGAGSGVAQTGYRIYNLAYSFGWTTNVPPIDFQISGLDDGEYYLDYNSTDNAGNVEITNTKTVILDNSAPSLTVETPAKNDALQDGVTFKVSAWDLSAVASVTFSIQCPQGNIVSPEFQSMPATLGADGKWSLYFDTRQLPDGFYLFVANGTDVLGNWGTTTVQFSIRNWATIELLPASETNKAGRTMPVKFSIRVKASVDPAQPFIHNEELTIKVYRKGYPGTILQTSTYGTTSKDYRIDPVGEKYITNFKTLSTPATYVVEIYRKGMLIGSFEFKTVK